MKTYWYIRKGPTNKVFKKDYSAVIYDHDYVVWESSVDNFIHKIDGPAIICFRGNYPLGFEWLINGLHHREDGPATIGFYGLKQWYLYSKKYDEKSWFRALLFEKLNNIRVE